MIRNENEYQEAVRRMREERDRLADHRAHLLDVLCCFYDFSGNKPSNTGELRDAWIRAQEKQNEYCRIYWPLIL